MSNTDSNVHGFDPLRLTVLVVDDSHNIRKIVTEMLRSTGLKNVVQAGSGVEAFEILKSRHIDLMILDLVMDQLDGIETTQLLRQGSDSPNRTLPILMITGHTERSNILRARDAGVNEIIAKPFSSQGLMDRLRWVMTHPRDWIVTKGFTGPDRRRKRNMAYAGPFRRGEDQAAERGAI